jgi:hypothetical protein
MGLLREWEGLRLGKVLGLSHKRREPGKISVRSHEEEVETARKASCDFYPDTEER